jgi:hypothetical protein
MEASECVSILLHFGPDKSRIKEFRIEGREYHASSKEKNADTYSTLPNIHGLSVIGTMVPSM